MTAKTSHDAESVSAEPEVPQLSSIIAEFPSAAAVKTAAKQMSASGWTDWDVHSPHPIHGIDDIIGIRPTRLPWITFAAGCTGIVIAILMQWWMNAIDYPFLISGKPLFGLPAAMPIIFELMVLLAAISTLVGMLLLNGLPRFSNPLFDSEAFMRVTSDRFVICVSAKDKKFDRDAVLQCLKDCHAITIDECFAPLAKAKRLPAGWPSLLVVFCLFALIPAVLVGLKRSTSTTMPRIHLIPDMDWQPKFRPQRASTLFADGRAMRPQVAGSVARGDLRADSRLHKGLEPAGSSGPQADFELPRPRHAVTKLVSADGEQSALAGRLVAQAAPPAAGAPAGAQPAAAEPAPPPDPLDSLPWVKTFPVPVTAKAMKRGQERYNIYCSACHGLAGDGDGLVTRRAMELEQGTWIKPSSFHTDVIRNQPVGRLFNSISNGVRKMPGYADSIPVEDRWAILLYVRALQQSRQSELKDVPADIVPQLRDFPKE